MEYLLGGLAATILAGSGALIWYLVRRWGKNEDRVHEIDAERDKAVADAAVAIDGLRSDLRRATDELDKACEALRLASNERDALRLELAHVKEQRERLLHAAAQKDPAALAAAIRNELLALEALRNMSRVPDAHPDGGEGEGAVHGTTPRRSP